MCYKRKYLFGSLSFLGIIGFLVSNAKSQAVPITIPQEKCHPIPPNSNDVYIIGYGSLINTVSKGKTFPYTGQNIPVNVKGFTRKWNCKGVIPGLSATYLGVDKNETGLLNGVAFKLPNLESLKEFDKREIFYCREQVNASEIKFLIQEKDDLNITFPDDLAQYWIYTVKPEFIAWPNRKYPIVQSYVDVFLSGCQEMDKTYGFTDYADNCMKLTMGWENSWINDRLLPRRPWVHTPNGINVDMLILKFFPKHFENVRVEQEISYGYGEGNNSENSGVMIQYGMPLGFALVLGSFIDKVLFK